MTILFLDMPSNQHTKLTDIIKRKPKPQVRQHFTVKDLTFHGKSKTINDKMANDQQSKVDIICNIWTENRMIIAKMT